MIQVNNLLVAVNFGEASNVALVYARSLAKNSARACTCCT